MTDDSLYVEQIDYQPSHEVFSQFSELKWSIYLDSAMLLPQLGRYSFIAIDPFLTIKNKNSKTWVNEVLVDSANPFILLKEYLSLYKMENLAHLPPFQGGAAGFFGYELFQHLEKITLQTIDDMDFPDMVIGFYDLIIAFDELLKKAWIISSGLPLQDIKARRLKAKKRASWLKKHIENNKNSSEEVKYSNTEKREIISNFTPSGYLNAVEKVREYILDGDIFEANISQRFSVELASTIPAYALYINLRKINPAPFSAYLNLDDTIIASASPERFLKLTGNKVETRPIKGTRKRSTDPIQDQFLAEELFNSEKDKAENVMIVDLMRNDLSTVCIDGSIHVPQLCTVETYPAVHHLVSVVEGELMSCYDAIDLLKATFPGGSVTGAPKIRAMEIIAELEPNCRGPYCGSIGYIGFNGDIDTSIIIRTFCIKNNTLIFQAGGAVVLDSDPTDEYEETLSKAAALRQAFLTV